MNQSNKKAQAIILCAGSGSRSGLLYNKIFYHFGRKTVLEMTLDNFVNSLVSQITLVISPTDEQRILSIIKDKYNVRLCYGGNTRFESAKKGISSIEGECDVVVIHDCARPYADEHLINRCIQSALDYGSGIAAVKSTDTLKKVLDGTIVASINREVTYRMQTPQAFDFSKIKKAYSSYASSMISNNSLDIISIARRDIHSTDNASTYSDGCFADNMSASSVNALDDNMSANSVNALDDNTSTYSVSALDDNMSASSVNALDDNTSTYSVGLPTDDSEIFSLAGFEARIVEGYEHNRKITSPADLYQVINTNLKIGTGFDVHRTMDGEGVVLGGVFIPHNKSLLGHSDADVLIHAIMDALLSGADLQDIGVIFPNTDQRYRGISSLQLLEQVKIMLKNNNCSIINISAVIIAEKPKLFNVIPNMKNTLAATLSIDPQCINISATTAEGLGLVGEEKGIAATAVCLLEKEKLN